MSGSRVDLKVVLLGKEAGGKTSLVERYLHDRFHVNVPYQNTIGAAFGAKKVEVNNVNVTMGIWDTAGSERYEAMSKIYYRSAKAAVVCYDLTELSSFDRAKFWVDELLKNEPECKIYLTGTKYDLIEDKRSIRKIEEDKVRQYAAEISCPTFETSSKTGFSIKELFYKIAKDFVEDPKNREPDVDPDTIDPNRGYPQEQKCRC